MMVLLSVLAVLVGAPVGDAPGAQPVQATSTEAAGPAAAAPGGTEIVCKTVAVTGTRFPARQCRTKAEWAGSTKLGREFLDNAGKPPCTVGCMLKDPHSKI
jgi:hypothetical protein